LPVEPFFRLSLTPQYEGYLRGRIPLFPRPEYARLFGLRPTRGPPPLPSELKSAFRRRPEAAVIETPVFRAVYLANKDRADPAVPVCGELVDGPPPEEVSATVGDESPDVEARLEKYRVCVTQLARRYEESKRAQTRFYFDHRAEELTANLRPLAYAQGGWTPELAKAGVFKDTAPASLGDLMPPSSFTGRP
jgi:hypothetical protein